MSAGVTRSISPVPSFMVSPVAQLVPVWSSAAMPLSLQSPHPCLGLPAPVPSKEAPERRQPWPNKAGMGAHWGPAPHATSLPGLTRAGVASRPLLQHSSKIYEISHNVGLGERRKSFSSLKSPKLPKSSSRSLNSTIIFLDNVIELFLVIAAGEIQMVSPIFTAAYIQEQLQESECKLYFIHGQSIPSKNLLPNNLDNFFFFWQGLIQDAWPY